MDGTPTKTPNRSNLARKAAALLEIVGVLAAGSLAAGWLLTGLGVKPLGDSVQAALASQQPDFPALSSAFLKNKSVEYACPLLLAFAIGWWRRRLLPRHYGITTAGQPVWKLVALGIVAFALFSFPTKLIWVVNRFVPLGQGSPLWALLNHEWTPSLWLFMAVASFAYQPVLEELLFRGYCQTRLEEDFGGTGAIVIVALFFALGHGQYHHLSAMSVSKIVTLILCSLGLGYVYWRSRSLIPGIVFHGLLNVPTKGVYDFLWPGLMIVCVVLTRRAWLTAARDFWRQAAASQWAGPALAGALLVSGLIYGSEHWPAVFMPIALVCLGIALSIAFTARRTFLNLSRSPEPS